MVTVGKGVLDTAVAEFFEGLRSYDAARAAKVLAPDVDFQTPWSGGPLRGRAAVEAHLKAWLGNAQARPTMTIRDVEGDGAVSRLRISVSGRFGAAAQRGTLAVLCLQHTIHQAVLTLE
ncbi:MAG TPA: nuclear transport factor 2 family protein [Candidatus Thermoplasmatota archaeon]|nr:nuclear transport factor 2 family protein [Candidatus Thermoplasmatota archaeon]